MLELDASNLVAIRELASLAEERDDVEEARRQILDAGLPPVLGDRLREGR